MLRKAMLLCAGALLSGCVSTQYAISDQQRLEGWFIGLSMAEFTEQTMLLPSSYYDTAQGRVFVVNGAPRTVVFAGSYGAPSVGVDATCKMLLTAAARDKVGNADTWRITGVSQNGRCRNVL